MRAVYRVQAPARHAHERPGAATTREGGFHEFPDPREAHQLAEALNAQRAQGRDNWTIVKVNIGRVQAVLSGMERRA